MRLKSPRPVRLSVEVLIGRVALKSWVGPRNLWGRMPRSRKAFELMSGRSKYDMTYRFWRLQVTFCVRGLFDSFTWSEDGGPCAAARVGTHTAITTARTWKCFSDATS